MLETSAKCFNCDRPDTVIPLISLRYAGHQTWICSRCLPTLIHEPQHLAHKLADGLDIPPAPHHEH